MLPRSLGRNSASAQRPARASTPETKTRAVERGVETGSRPEAGSLEIGLAAGFCGKLVDGRKVCFLQIGVFVENLLFGHTRAKPPENVPHGDAQATNARLSRALARLDRDPGAHL